MEVLFFSDVSASNATKMSKRRGLGAAAGQKEGGQEGASSRLGNCAKDSFVCVATGITQGREHAIVPGRAHTPPIR